MRRSPCVWGATGCDASQRSTLKEGTPPGTVGTITEPSFDPANVRSSGVGAPCSLGSVGCRKSGRSRSPGAKSGHKFFFAAKQMRARRMGGSPCSGTSSMTALKHARKLIEEKPRTEAAALSDLVISLESKRCSCSNASTHSSWPTSIWPLNSAANGAGALLRQEGQAAGLGGTGAQPGRALRRRLPVPRLAGGCHKSLRPQVLHVLAWPASAVTRCDGHVAGLAHHGSTEPASDGVQPGTSKTDAAFVSLQDAAALCTPWQCAHPAGSDNIPWRCEHRRQH